jgi:ribonuclease HI
MGVSGHLQVTLKAKRSTAPASSWSLPAFAVASRSASVEMAVDDLVVIRSRIADALHIHNHDEVDFLFDELGETFRLKVTVSDAIDSDVLLHDFMELGLAESVQIHRNGVDVILKERSNARDSDDTSPSSPTSSSSVAASSETTTSHCTSDRAPLLRLPMQEMWSGIRAASERRGCARLYFDGCSRDSPHGPCGYGFHIVRGMYSARGDELIRGYGYAGMEKSHNEMEYYGLMEGLVWAIRLDLETLVIYGASELIIKQVKGEYNIKNPRLKSLHQKLRRLLASQPTPKCNFQLVHKEENEIANGLANLGIAAKENVTTCNWPNINRLMATDL